MRHPSTNVGDCALFFGYTSAWNPAVYCTASRAPYGDAYSLCKPREIPGRFGEANVKPDLLAGAVEQVLNVGMVSMGICVGVRIWQVFFRNLCVPPGFYFACVFVQTNAWTLPRYFSGGCVM